MVEKDPNAQSAAEIQRLAKEYVDLWEQQVKTLAGDDGFATAMSKTFELMNAGAASMAAMAANPSSQPKGAGYEPGDHAGFGAYAQSNASASSTATGTSSGYSDDDVHQLIKRIGELENRVAELEQQSPRCRPTSKSD